MQRAKAERSKKNPRRRKRGRGTETERERNRTVESENERSRRRRKEAHTRRQRRGRIGPNAVCRGEKKERKSYSVCAEERRLVSRQDPLTRLSLSLSTYSPSEYQHARVCVHARLVLLNLSRYSPMANRFTTKTPSARVPDVPTSPTDLSIRDVFSQLLGKGFGKLSSLPWYSVFSRLGISKKCKEARGWLKDKESNAVLSKILSEQWKPLYVG